VKAAVESETAKCYHDSMKQRSSTARNKRKTATARSGHDSQLLIRKIDRTLKRKLRNRAERYGQSMEQTARDILRAALTEENEPKKGLGTQIAERFRGLDLREEDFPRLHIEARFPEFDK
jgi:antitoxin FitA